MQGPVGVIGQGYVGLPMALALIDSGECAVGFETDAERLALLCSGRSYIDDVPDAALRDALATGRFRPSDHEPDLEACGQYLICVPTPLDRNTPDLRAVLAAAETVGRLLRPGDIVVLVSTTYVGTTGGVLRKTLENTSGLSADRDFVLGYSPERIDPGNERYRVRNTPRLVSAIGEAALLRVTEFMASFVEHVHPVPSPEIAELAKLIENTFRFVNIALLNEISVYAAAIGVDIWAAVSAAATKPYGFMPFWPGPGVGGHCLPVDSMYLAWGARHTAGTPLRIVELSRDVNESMAAHVVDRVNRGLTRRGLGHRARIVVVGMTYKRNVSDLRGTPALPVIRQFLEAGHDVMVYDPLASSTPAELAARWLAELSAQDVSAADAVVVLADHDVIDWPMLKDSAGYIFDAHGRLEGLMVERL